MRPEGPFQRRLKPWQILAVILYGETDYIQWTGIESVSLKLGPLARFLGIPNYRLRDYLMWLHEYGYLRTLNLSYGKAELEICTPVPYLRALQGGPIESDRSE